MILETLLLADNAVAVEGKYYVHGGGITRMTPPQLPWAHPMLTFLLLLRAADADDLMTDHSVSIAVVAPDGGFVLPRGELGLRHEKPPEVLDGERIYANVAVTVAPLLFSMEGLHRIEVDLDGERVADVPLPVQVAQMR